MRPCLPAIEQRQAERQRNGVVIRPPRRPDLPDEAVDLLLFETGIGERGVERLAGKIEHRRLGPPLEAAAADARASGFSFQEPHQARHPTSHPASSPPRRPNAQEPTTATWS